MQKNISIAIGTEYQDHSGHIWAVSAQLQNSLKLVNIYNGEIWTPNYASFRHQVYAGLLSKAQPWHILPVTNQNITQLCK